MHDCIFAGECSGVRPGCYWGSPEPTRRPTTSCWVSSKLGVLIYSCFYELESGGAPTVFF